MQTKDLMQRRRAISTIIGGLIFLVIMVGAFTALVSALQLNFDMVATQVAIGREEVEKAQEKFSVLPSAKPSESNKLFVQVENKGTRPIEVVDVWVIEKTDTPFPATRHEIEFEDSFVAPGTKKQILENITPAITLTDSAYDIKVVTSLGTVVTEELIVPLDPLRIKLFTIPPNVRSGGNITLAMHVFNRGNTTVFDVQPSHQFFKNAPPTDPAGTVDEFSPRSQTPVDLEPQEFAIFTWDIELTGAVGTQTAFTTSANGTDSVTGETVVSNTDSVDVRFISSPKRLFQEPDIFVIIPGPFGTVDVNNQGLWGVVVANPTEIDIKVSKVNIQLLVSQDGNKVFNDAQCQITPIIPSTASEWSCPIRNNVQWIDLTNPETVPGRGIMPFMAKVNTGGLAEDDEPSISVITSVVTSSGVFGKTGFSTGVRNAGDAIANVYLTSDPNNELTNSNIRGNISKIKSGDPIVKFNVTLADFSTSISHIDIGTGLSIIVPAGFTVDTSSIQVDSQFEALVVAADVIAYSDGSTQIIVTTDEDIGESGQEAATVRFEAEAPVVSDLAGLYPLFILASGKTGNNFTVMTFAEIPLQVVP